MFTFFLDSSALLAAVLSSHDDSQGRVLLQLGETGALDLRVSRDVLRETEAIIRRRRPAVLPRLAQLLAGANVATTSDPDEETIQQCVELTGYLPDARVLAAAIECDADLFVTYDAEHFLQNPLLGPPDTRLRVKTSGEALTWYRERTQDTYESE